VLGGDFSHHSYLYQDIYVGVRVCVCVYMYVYEYVYIYIYIYTYLISVDVAAIARLLGLENLPEVLGGES